MNQNLIPVANGSTDSTDFMSDRTSSGIWETMKFQYNTYFLIYIVASLRHRFSTEGLLTRAAEGLVSHSVSAGGSPGDSVLCSIETFSFCEVLNMELRS